MARLESMFSIVSLAWLTVVIGLIVAGLGFLGIKDETISIREQTIEEALAEIADLRRERDRAFSDRGSDCRRRSASTTRKN